MHTYVQNTGHWYDDRGTLYWTGYAGGNEGKNPEGVNNHDAQQIRCVGPLPCGFYTIGKPYTHHRLGKVTMDLLPDATNEMFDRGDFRIHGWKDGDGVGLSAKQTSSEGCICRSGSADRLRVWNSGDHRLRVVANEEDRTTA